MRIWKWTLAATDVQTLELPVGAGILTVQTQGDMPQLWALCDEKATAKDKRNIAIYGTGNPMPDEPGDYIATFQMHGGALVFHAFEVEMTMRANALGNRRAAFGASVLTDGLDGNGRSDAD